MQGEPKVDDNVPLLEATVRAISDFTRDIQGIHEEYLLVYPWFRIRGALVVGIVQSG